ncbi:MAG: hypothetical protein LCH76_10025 [Actinobacteria bacterium]|nr:hypothetical protein [Actinomycetota bacterium]
MGPDLRITWAEVCANPADFEKLVKLLLLRLYPDGEVIDGQGGDGGRELQIRTGGELVLFEAKAFTGRVSNSRRRQVQRSLVSAARNQPDQWNLVVPIDHNPSELAWFNGLRQAEYPFVDRWLGQSWLEEQLTQHDDLIRYATGDKLLRYVQQYNLETAALAGGTPDLIRRHDALEHLADEISPDWRPLFGRLPDGTRSVTFEPKHPGAAADAPIGITFKVSVPDEPETAELRHRLRDSQLFGSSVEIPGQYVTRFSMTGPPELGLPGEDVELVRLVMLETPETGNLPQVSLAVHRPTEAFPTVALPLRAASRITGSGGGVRITSRDSAQAVEVVLEARFDEATLKLNLTSLNPEPVLPAAVLPALRLMAACHAPNELVVTLRQDGHTARQEIALPADLPPGPDADLVTFVEDLTTIQDKLRQPFPLPAEFSQGDLKRASRLRRLLEGEVVPWMPATLTVTLDPSKIAGFKAQFPGGGGQLQISSDDHEVRLGDEVVHTGPMYLTGTVTVDLDSIPDHPEHDAEVTAIFRLVDGEWFQARLGHPPDDKLSDEAGPGVDDDELATGRARVAYLPGRGEIA